jgi:DDE superfamily endonuclease/Homeodomain-like domain
MRRSQGDLTAPRSRLGSGDDGSFRRASRGWMRSRGRAARGRFPPAQVAEIKALACELPAESGRPLSRWSAAELAEQAVQRGIVCSISGTTVWRYLAEDAIRPWQWRSWIFPRDPNFAEKAGRVLDLYERRWEGKLLHPGDYVISADEKSQLQALRGCHEPAAPGPGRPGLREFEYERLGTLAYLAAMDVHDPQRGLFGRCEPKTGIQPFSQLVDQVMTSEPYASAQRVFWIVDNGSSHAGKRSVDRLQSAWPNLILVHLPVHASWLNQIEIYFSILQRKALTPRHFESLTELKRRIIGFQDDWRQHAKPFDWRYTRRDLQNTLDRITAHEQLRAAA